jgi:hypothetical protein
MPITKETNKGVRGRAPAESVSARANEQAKGQTTLDRTNLEVYSPQAPGVLFLRGALSRTMAVMASVSFVL